LSFLEEIEEARRTYKDVLNGYSIVNFGEDTLFVKHLSDFDHGTIQEYKKTCYSVAQKKGVLTRKEKVDSLIEQELWSEDKEERVSRLREEACTLTTTKGKLVLKKQIKVIQERLSKLEKETSELTREKDELLGITCESYSETKANERYVYHCLYKDEELKERYLSEEEFDELESISLSLLIVKNNEKLSELSRENIERIAACPFFLNSLMISNGDPMVFFGKPVIHLTNFQQALFSTGQRYKSVIENSGKVPPNTTSLRNMVDWYEDTIPASRDSKSKAADGGATGETVFGADKDELKALTEKKDDGRPLVDLGAAAGKMLDADGNEKKYLDMNDMLKLHGEID
jgi:3-methyladenine DNA glycosylase AlkC